MHSGEGRMDEATISGLRERVHPGLLRQENRFVIIQANRRMKSGMPGRLGTSAPRLAGFSQAILGCTSPSSPASMEADEDPTGFGYPKSCSSRRRFPRHPYYEKWMKVFPDIRTLAAPRPEVLKACRAGYYSGQEPPSDGPNPCQRFRRPLPFEYEPLSALPGFGPTPRPPS